MNLSISIKNGDGNIVKQNKTNSRGSAKVDIRNSDVNKLKQLTTGATLDANLSDTASNTVIQVDDSQRTDRFGSVNIDDGGGNTLGQFFKRTNEDGPSVAIANVDNGVSNTATQVAKSGAGLIDLTDSSENRLDQTFAGGNASLSSFENSFFNIGSQKAITGTTEVFFQDSSGNIFQQAAENGLGGRTALNFNETIGSKATQRTKGADLIIDSKQGSFDTTVQQDDAGVRGDLILAKLLRTKRNKSIQVRERGSSGEPQVSKTLLSITDGIDNQNLQVNRGAKVGAIDLIRTKDNRFTQLAGNNRTAIIGAADAFGNAGFQMASISDTTALLQNAFENVLSQQG